MCCFYVCVLYVLVCLYFDLFFDYVSRLLCIDDFLRQNLNFERKLLIWPRNLSRKMRLELLYHSALRTALETFMVSSYGQFCVPTWPQKFLGRSARFKIPWDFSVGPAECAKRLNPPPPFAERERSVCKICNQELLDLLKASKTSSGAPATTAGPAQVCIRCHFRPQIHHISL